MNNKDKLSSQAVYLKLSTKPHHKISVKHKKYKILAVIHK